ncbi:ASCH domain-containing protein [Hymenobacter sp. H14-R3]|uniref:ASCH domain-containing protein n=1 Tax=Hymenobacter sp. H14-R3 TaxID=3046308 RepID=UPI0024BB5848|nr:ASCH domain-containing protein [Hymenobacter sp. H14-R3]MDJ0364677.1 ASCH domain-containing protein [Hymenobacter sp. H14-R3]
MKILGFNDSFVAAIVAGTKVHTIREGQRWRVGEVAHFCVRAHQPDQREFWWARPILAIQAIELTNNTMQIDGRLLAAPELLALAQADGFPTTQGLFAFFADKPLPFQGQLLHWTSCRY